MALRIIKDEVTIEEALGILEKAMKKMAAGVIAELGKLAIEK